MLSATVIVANSKGVTPPSCNPALAAASSGGREIEQGVTEPPAETRPANGLAIAASSWPIARRNARCGARSMPSVMTRDGRFPSPDATVISTPPGAQQAAGLEINGIISIIDVEVN